MKTTVEQFQVGDRVRLGAMATNRTGTIIGIAHYRWLPDRYTVQCDTGAGRYARR